MSKPKAIVMVGGGTQEVPAVKQVQDMGYKCIVTDRNPYAPAFRETVHGWSYDASRTRDISSAISETYLGVVGIFTLTELFPQVAWIADCTGLGGVAPDRAEACRRKVRTKRVWFGKIPTAKGYAIYKEDDALLAFDTYGEDVFIKPNIGCGGEGCKRITNKEDVLTEYHYMKKPFLMEEYLEGSVHDVNAVFGRHHKFFPLSISDRWFEDGVEIRAECPTFLDADKQAELYALTEKAALALGIDFGPVKADVMLTKDGFKFMEMAPRLHGPSGTLEMIPRALGFRPLEAAIHALVGNEIPEECMKPKWKRRCITHRKRNGEKWFETLEE